jgi:riboflavin transporter FmnP
MREETLARIATHDVKPLIIRGGLARTFGSLATFLAMLFLFFGFYALGDAFEHPLAAQAGGVLAAAFSITLAAILIYFLLKPLRGTRSRAARFRREE